MCIYDEEKLEDQSVEEWKTDYAGDNEVQLEHEELFGIDFSDRELEHSLSVKADYSQIIDGSIHKFRYVDHRTTRTKSVALEFESIDGKFNAVMFCNVQLKSSRGTCYPSGFRGQFIPPKRGKFRKFWMKVVGKVPRRWCRVHEVLRSAFRDEVFTGKVEHAVSSKGEPYFKIVD